MKEPFHIQWHITNFCNLRCRHCYQEDFSKSHDLDWSGLKKVADSFLATLKEWDRAASIHLTGGEPLLKQELFLLLDHLDQQPGVQELGIISNGLLFDKAVIQKLSSYSKLKKIKISLDGADAEIHDSLRRRGAFEKVMQTLSLIQEEGEFEIILMFTLMKRNYRSLPPLLHLCQDLGIDGLILERFIPWGRGREIIDQVLSREEWREVVRALLRFFSADTEEFDVLPYQAFQVIFGEGESELSGAPCVAGTDGFCIMPQGDLFPCRRFPVSIGNLLSQPLKHLWERSEILAKLKKKENLKGRCGRCSIQDCRGCRSLALALTGDYLEEDPHCWYPDS